MTGRALAIATGLALLAAGSAEACVIQIDLDLNRIREADAIAVGRVTKFYPELPVEQSRLGKWLSTIRPNDKFENARDWTDGARVTFKVTEVISGNLPPNVIVDWPIDTNNSPPKYMSGDYIFAVYNKPESEKDSTTTHTIMHQMCSGSFVFRRGTNNANAIRAMYGLGPEVEHKTLSELLKPPYVPWYILVVTGLLALAGAQIVVVLTRGERRSRRN